MLRVAGEMLTLMNSSLLTKGMSVVYKRATSPKFFQANTCKKLQMDPNGILMYLVLQVEREKRWSKSCSVPSGAMLVLGFLWRIRLHTKRVGCWEVSFYHGSCQF